jgi:hypothetical protein
MLPVNLNDLTDEHIQSLFDSEVAEGLTLEYKQQLPTNQSEEKKEFLFDIAAMANSAGGDIVYGIVERRGEDQNATGIAQSLMGLKLTNVQDEIIRLSNLIKDGIAPRITGIQMIPVNCQDGDVLAIRIPKSWNRPHMVTIGSTNKFYGRVGATKYLMSVDEIGRAFSEQSDLGRTIEQWRRSRSERLSIQGGGPIPLSSEVTFLFHVIPAESFTRTVLDRSWRVSEEEKLHIYVPHGAASWRYNADGFLCFGAPVAENQYCGYTQIFRSGIIEYADSAIFGPPHQGMQPMIFGQEIERQMVQCYKDALRRFQSQGQSGPVYIGFSLTGLTNKMIFATLMSSVFRKGGIRENIFVSPEVFVDITETETHPYPKTLLPLVDTMWQIDGREGTPFRKPDGWYPFGNYQ